MSHTNESMKCEQHNQNIDFVLIDDQFIGEEKLLCQICFKQISGLKKVYRISEAINILQEKKNSEFSEQKTIILDQLHKINNHIDTIVEFQGSLQQLINNILEALQNWKQELENRIYDISQYNFLQELNKLNNQDYTFINNQKIFEFIEIKRLQYSEKIKNNIQNLQVLATRNQGLCQLLDITHIQKIISIKLNQTVFQQDKVLSLAFNYNDSLIASSCNKEIKLQKFQDGKIGDVIDTLNEHTQIIYTIIFSKRKNWLFSAGKDLSIILWKPVRLLFNFTITNKQQYYNAHKDSILQLVLNQKENQLISCSSDCKISIWTVNYKQNSIQYQYSLERHTGPVISVCLNQSNNLLVSSGLDKQIIIWSQKNDQEWIFKQVIDKSTNDFGFRISFISDQQIVWQSFKRGQTHIFQEDNGIFKEITEQRLQLAMNAQNDGDYSFPSIFDTKKQILIQKYHQHIYFLNLNSQNKLNVQQEQIILNDEQSYGNLSNCGKYLAIWCNQKFSIYEIDYVWSLKPPQ
ncbi:unnamed protein product [Paramecium primaurelia]|uniref:WD domain, G-beta repeat protein n=1 Tax=Paramecium primaurelia TaxID=5886 RepID=A0A8S1LTU5_PARPR|nr:unnamed protein product [Paramecium primaurelia]